MLDTLIQGLLLGGLYCLFALGQSLMFGVMRLTNTAQGDFIVLAAFGAIAALAANALVPKLTVFMFAILAARAIWGLSPYRKKAKAMRIGVWEVVYGALTVLAAILGYLLGF